MFSGACQPAEISLSLTPFPSSTPVALTATSTRVVPSSTATVPPTATPVPAPLSLQEPWLVYYHRYSDDNFVVIVNQDGTGMIRANPICSSDIPESSSNQMVVIGGVYLFQRSQPTWTLVQPCGSFTGSNKGGLLAVSEYGTQDAFSTLRIHELPSGRLRDQFSLFKCTDQAEPCDTAYIDTGMLERLWSPNGRYLAFAAVLDGQSDLYMYDSQTGNVLRLTSGPDNVSQLWWSPDGEWIIMGELHESGYPFTTSVWAVSARDGEMRRLYSLEDGYPQGILGWLDDSRFIVFGGTSLYDATDLPAYNLYLVDIDASRTTPLFEGSFFTADLAVEAETIAVGVYRAEGYEEGGLYLISVLDPTPRFVGPQTFASLWDGQLELFVTYETCEDDPEGIRAFNLDAEWQCIHASFTENYPSPDGKWEVSAREGTWLKTEEGLPVLVSRGLATQVIWRLDSEGFFFVEDEILYYVSAREAIPIVVDQYLNGNSITYQWLDGD
jgi:hypothetical protein